MSRSGLAGLMSISIAAGVALTSSAHAQENGVNESLLRRSLEAIATGECPSSLLAPMLRGACQGQMPAAASNLARKGKIKQVEYEGMEQSMNGPAEVYRVIYEHGEQMWMIKAAPDGKAQVLWSPTQ